MTDNEIVKTSGEISCNKIKAIYPHIVVGGDVDNPYYSIHWYDVEKQTMYCGYSSSMLGIVHKWLEEEFEVVEADIGDLFNRLQADKEALIAGQETLQRALAEKNAEIEEYQNYINQRLNDAVTELLTTYDVERAKSEAIKEFAERLKNRIPRFGITLYTTQTIFEVINNLVKEMAGDTA